MPFRKAKVDRNQLEIVNGLRRIGASVQSLAAIGKGCPDLLVGFRGFNHLLEVKDGEKVPSQRKLTEMQCYWHNTWRGLVVVVNNLDEAYTAIGAEVDE